MTAGTHSQYYLSFFLCSPALKKKKNSPVICWSGSVLLKNPLSLAGPGPCRPLTLTENDVLKVYGYLKAKCAHFPCWKVIDKPIIRFQILDYLLDKPEQSAKFWPECVVLFSLLLIFLLGIIKSTRRSFGNIKSIFYGCLKAFLE